MFNRIDVAAKFLPSQLPFYMDDNDPYISFIGGYRSGKTHVGAEKMIKNMLINSGMNFLCVAPTHSLLKTVNIPKVKEMFAKYQLKIKVNLSDMIGTTPIGDIYFRSGHQPETIIGFEVAGIWIDEPGVMKKEALERASARLSDAGAKVKQTILTGTPEPGKQGNWWEEFCENSGVKIYQSSTREAVEYGTIDRDYITRLESIYSPKLLQAYIDGLFVSINEHLMFYEFRKDVHAATTYKLNPDAPILMSWDFNVNPLCVNIAQMRGKELWIFDEIHLQNSDTRQAMDQILNRYGKYDIPFFVFGDASARARDTRNSTKTDMDIILAKLAAAGKRTINKINLSNPSIRNSANLVNGLLNPASGTPLMYLDPVNCKHIIKDFLNVTGDKALDERNGFGHHSDGVRYMSEKIYGYKAVRRAAA